MNTLNKEGLKVNFQKFMELIKINYFLKTKKIIIQIYRTKNIFKPI